MERVGRAAAADREKQPALKGDVEKHGRKARAGDSTEVAAKCSTRNGQRAPSETHPRVRYLIEGWYVHRLRSAPRYACAKSAGAAYRSFRR